LEKDKINAKLIERRYNTMKRKVLIIKIGFSETLDGKISRIPSYGDIIRTTPLLHLFKDDNVYWLVAEEGLPLLEGNPYIDEILIYNLTSILQLQREHFDIVVNLEKIPGICALTDSINAWLKYGFRFDEINGTAEAYKGASEVLYVSEDREIKLSYNKYWQEALFEMVDAKWDKEDYVFSYKPKSEVIFDVGFNYMVGSKWPTKAWPMDYWKKLEQLLAGKYSISYQQGEKDLYTYMDWLHSCKLVVSNDSLGLHLGIALKKKVVGIIGPTVAREIYMYNMGELIEPDPGICPEIPCLKPECRNKVFCLDTITPEVIGEKIKTLL